MFVVASRARSVGMALDSELGLVVRADPEPESESPSQTPSASLHRRKDTAGSLPLVTALTRWTSWSCTKWLETS